MGLKRYDMIVRQSGTRMEERTDGDWVNADESEAEIDRLLGIHEYMTARAAEQAEMIRVLENQLRAPVDAAESGMQDAASEWTKAWRIIAQSLKEMRYPECDHNTRAIIARLAANNMLIVGVDNVKD